MPKSSQREAIISRIVTIINEHRTSQNLSLLEVATRAGLSHTMVMRVEKGERIPTIDTLLRISEALGVELSKIVADAERSVKTAKSTPR
ncbi:MAG: helix-turn-helix transcriptional regulator [Chthoniobacteraceae bacterium]